MKQNFILLFLIIILLTSCTSEEQTEHSLKNISQNSKEPFNKTVELDNFDEIPFETILQDIDCGYYKDSLDFVIRDKEDVNKLVGLIENSMVRYNYQTPTNTSKIKDDLINKLTEDHMLILANQGNYGVICCEINITQVSKTDRGIEVSVKNIEGHSGGTMTSSPCHMIRIPLLEEDVIFNHKIKGSRAGFYHYTMKIHNNSFYRNGRINYETYETCNFNSTCDLSQLDESNTSSDQCNIPPFECETTLESKMYPFECETTVNCSYKN